MRTQEILLYHTSVNGQPELRLSIPNSAINKLSGHPLFTKRKAGFWIVPFSISARLAVLDLFKEHYHIHEYGEDEVYLRTHVASTELKNETTRKDALDEALYEFTHWLEVKGYKGNTVSSYESLVRPFFKHFPHLHFRNIGYSEYVLFESEKLVKHEFSVSYKRQLINALRLFTTCFENRFHLELDRISMPQRDEYIPEPLSLTDIHTMLNNTADLKQKTILTCLYHLGLRTSEVVNIRIHDIDFNYQFLKIYNDDKLSRRLHCKSEILKTLEHYFNEFSPAYFLFESRPGVRYTERRIQQICASAAEGACMNRKVSPAILRQSLGVHLLTDGVDVRTVQKMLGHRHLKSTERYTYGIPA